MTIHLYCLIPPEQWNYLWPQRSNTSIVLCARPQALHSSLGVFFNTCVPRFRLVQQMKTPLLVATLRETNSQSPWKIGRASPKGNFIFQPSIFRCKLAVSFREEIVMEILLASSNALLFFFRNIIAVWSSSGTFSRKCCWPQILRYHHNKSMRSKSGW